MFLLSILSASNSSSKISWNKQFDDIDDRLSTWQLVLMLIHMCHWLRTILYANEIWNLKFWKKRNLQSMMLKSFCFCCQSTIDVSWSTFREVIVTDSEKLYFARLFQSVIVVFAIFFAFISIFALHTSIRTIVHFFTSWR